MKIELRPQIESAVLELLSLYDISLFRTDEAYNLISFPSDCVPTDKEADCIISYLSRIQIFGKEIQSILQKCIISRNPE